MQISPAIERPTRELLGHAIRGEFDDFGRKLAAFKDDGALQESLRLTAVVTAYAAVDDNDGVQLSDADMREPAESVAELETRIEISADEVHSYLSRVVFGDDPSPRSSQLTTHELGRDRFPLGLSQDRVASRAGARHDGRRARPGSMRAAEQCGSSRTSAGQIGRAHV